MTTSILRTLNENNNALVKCSVTANARIMTEAVANVDDTGGTVDPQSLLLVINSGCFLVIASHSRILFNVYVNKNRIVSCDCCWLLGQCCFLCAS